LHSEKTPSFSVDADRGLWFCFGCSEGGDTIRLIERAHGTNFQGALKILGIDGASYKPDPEVVAARGRRRQISDWSRCASMRLREALLEIGTEAHLSRQVRRIDGADVALLREHEAALRRRWQILCDLDDDIAANPAEMYTQEADIAALISTVEQLWP
jgi:hypothetical protein